MNIYEVRGGSLYVVCRFAGIGEEIEAMLPGVGK